ncbi:MAG: 1,4-alpha-glucan branching protein GlgB [Saprospiraceae bacterium]|nr:1,4-alpha-glucan branching protein GlgB [Saprospiraceae bacterium]
MAFLSRFSDFDIELFKSGKHFRLYEKLGSHLMENEGVQGAYFAVWAPNAKRVSVVGDFNQWNRDAAPMISRSDNSGIWELFVPSVPKGSAYKYSIKIKPGVWMDKGDPYALKWETPPKTASIVWDTYYEWNDQAWMQKRTDEAGQSRPYSVYEVHLGSWRKQEKEGNRSLTYVELADEFVNYVKEMAYTHVEFLPVMEHPYYGSWGYQVTGYYAASSRYGSPQDLMFLIERLHQEGIGVILDWVPSHFPGDAHGLIFFDGTHLYEHADPRKGFHPDWKSYIFNYGRNEVRSFLISNALFWLDRYHVDGLRVDAVASMLYLDYSRNEGEWIPNYVGGKENLEAIAFLKEFNETVYKFYPDTVTIAEESTSWPGVSRPTYENGLGFGQKWMMGWMHDTLNYFKRSTIYRPWHQNELTFSIAYAFAENFMLPFSHDEVVHGKSSLLGRMPGDEWQRFAQLRLMYAYMYTHPGTKLLFMGGEFAQSFEWSHERGLDWWLLRFEPHQGIQRLVKTLNHLYRDNTPMYDLQFKHEGFEWIDLEDKKNCVLSYLRRDKEGNVIIAVLNFTQNVISHYQIGSPLKGKLTEILNTDDPKFGGSGVLNGEIETIDSPYHNRPYSFYMTLPPLGCAVFKYKEIYIQKTEEILSVEEVTDTKKVIKKKSSKLKPK